MAFPPSIQGPLSRTFYSSSSVLNQNIVNPLAKDVTSSRPNLFHILLVIEFIAGNGSLKPGKKTYYAMMTHRKRLLP
jgi:hypothetical protein